MTTQNQDIKYLPEFLRHAIDNEITRATEEEFETMKVRLDKRKSEIVAGVVLHIQKMIEMQTLENKLIVTVELRD